MKKIIILLIPLLFVFCGFAQQQLHIHHINIENGDATIIGIFDTGLQKYTSKIIIDGGQTAPQKMLLPYISKVIGTDKESFHFNYIILSHYHDDHYNGLLAIKDGKLTGDSIIDPGGYKVSSYFNHDAKSGTKPESMKLAMAWLRALDSASHHKPEPFIKGRSKMMLRFDATQSGSIGNKIILGKVGGNSVELECIAGWGNTLSASGKIEQNPSPKRNSANNFSLAFILSCGQFRYFIGGDMGGSSASSYINQESTVTKFLIDEYPVSVSSKGDTSVKGHVCGFKSNHHGSNNSNTASFMNGMYPAIVVTSGGNNTNWHLPHPTYIDRLGKIKPLSVSSSLKDGYFNKGVYFTNLYNFSSSFPSLTKANNLFNKKKGVSYSYGNDIPNVKKSYMIKVTDENTLSEKSMFEVGSVDLTKSNPYEKLATFNCHRRN